MDHKQFDELVARLAKGPSRRDALKGAIGGALASIGLGAAVDDTEAQGEARGEAARELARCIRDCDSNRKCIRRCRRPKRRKCPAGSRRCGTKRCINLRTSERHCGRCNNRCDADQICDAGTCVVQS